MGSSRISGIIALFEVRAVDTPGLRRRSCALASCNHGKRSSGKMCLMGRNSAALSNVPPMRKRAGGVADGVTFDPAFSRAGWSGHRARRPLLKRVPGTAGALTSRPEPSAGEMAWTQDRAVFPTCRIEPFSAH